MKIKSRRVYCCCCLPTAGENEAVEKAASPVERECVHASALQMSFKPIAAEPIHFSVWPGELDSGIGIPFFGKPAHCVALRSVALSLWSDFVFFLAAQTFECIIAAVHLYCSQLELTHEMLLLLLRSFGECRWPCLNLMAYGAAAVVAAVHSHRWYRCSMQVNLLHTERFHIVPLLSPQRGPIFTTSSTTSRAHFKERKKEKLLFFQTLFLKMRWREK